MGRSGKVLLFWISLSLFIISFSGTLYIGSLKTTPLVAGIQYIAVFLMILSFLNIISLLLIQWIKRRWFIIVSRISTYSFPFISTLPYIIFNYTDLNASTLLIIVFTVLMILSGFLTTIYLFFTGNAGELRSIIILLLLIVAAIIFQRTDILASAMEEFLLPVILIITTGGIYLFGLRCLYSIEKNRYLQIFSYIASIFTSIGGYAFLFALVNANVDAIEAGYFVPAVLLTLTFLFSLPLSGYIQWSGLHKAILRKIMIAWVFFFLIFSVKFIYPDFFKTITLKEREWAQEFLMRDYKIVDKNGLEPE